MAEDLESKRSAILARIRAADSFIATLSSTLEKIEGDGATREVHESLKTLSLAVEGEGNWVEVLSAAIGEVWDGGAEAIGSAVEEAPLVDLIGFRNKGLVSVLEEAMKRVVDICDEREKAEEEA